MGEANGASSGTHFHAHALPDPTLTYPTLPYHARSVARVVVLEWLVWMVWWIGGGGGWRAGWLGGSGCLPYPCSPTFSSLSCNYMSWWQFWQDLCDVLS